MIKIEAPKALETRVPAPQRGQAVFSIDAHVLASLLALPEGYYITGIYHDPNHGNQLLFRVESDTLPNTLPGELLPNLGGLRESNFMVQGEAHGDMYFRRYSIQADWVKPIKE